MESLYLLFLVAVILIVVSPLTFDGKVSYDFLENHGSLLFKLWFVKFIVAKIKRKGTSIILITKKENNYVNAEFGEKQLKFLIFFKNEVGNKLKVRKLNVYSVVGAGDPFKSALVSSAFSSAVLAALARLKLVQKTGSFNLKNKTNFFETKFAVGSSIRVSISIYDVIFSFFVSILRKTTKKI